MSDDHKPSWHGFHGGDASTSYIVFGATHGFGGAENAVFLTALTIPLARAFFWLVRTLHRDCLQNEGDIFEVVIQEERLTVFGSQKGPEWH